MFTVTELQLIEIAAFFYRKYHCGLPDEDKQFENLQKKAAELYLRPEAKAPTKTAK